MTSKGVITAEYRGGKVIVRSSEDVNALRQRGFGDLVGKRLVLSPYETLYLMEKELHVTNGETGREVAFSDLLNKYRAENADFWILYLMYRDLRGKGYVVKEGKDLGVDFKVFRRQESGKESPKFAVMRLGEGESMTFGRIARKADVVRREGLELVLAVVDRRSEIVYYSLSEMPS